MPHAYSFFTNKLEPVLVVRIDGGDLLKKHILSNFIFMVYKAIVNKCCLPG